MLIPVRWKEAEYQVLPISATVGGLESEGKGPPVPIDQLHKAILAGETLFGENKAQELRDKTPLVHAPFFRWKKKRRWNYRNT